MSPTGGIINMQIKSIIQRKRTGVALWAPFFSNLWLLCVLNSVVAWFSFSIYLRLLATIGIVAVTLSRGSYANLKNKRGAFWACAFFYLWIAIRSANIVGLTSITINYLSFLLMFLWPASLMKDSYKFFRYIVLFFAVGSSILTILSIMGLTSPIPHFEMPAQSALHANRDDFYYVYGIFPELRFGNEALTRACGMMQEPGHFAVILGFVYILDRITHTRINPILFVAAVLTFSSNFFFAVLFIEAINLYRNYIRVLRWTLALLIGGFVIYYSLPSNIRELFYYMAYERNFVQAEETYSSSGSLTSLLDDRANELGISTYEMMSFEEKMVGKAVDREIVLSDYRGMVLRFGWVALILSLIALFAASSGLKKSYRIPVLLFLALVLLHRSWMFNPPYMYYFTMLSVVLYKYEKDSKTIVKKVDSLHLS